MIPEPAVQPIQWRQVWGLAALLGAIQFSFMIYGFYQPKVLTLLGFGLLASQWGILQGVVGLVVEPWLAGLSDRVLAKTGSRLPQITIGVTIAGLLFVAIAMLSPSLLSSERLLNSGPAQILRWVLVAMMTAWLLAMIAIRGPIVALLRQITPVSQLPVANEILIIVAGLLGAIAPLLDEWLQSIPTPQAFILGAIVLMVGGTCLVQVMPRPTPGLPVIAMPSMVMTSSTEIQPWHRLSLLVGIGLGTGCLLRLLTSVVPTALKTSLPMLKPNLLTAIILLIAAIAARLFGDLAQRRGVAAALQWGLGAVVILLFCVNIPLSNGVGVVILISAGLAMSLVMISSVPVVLSSVSATQAGLGTGLFFGGSGLGGIVVSVWNQFLTPLTPLNAIGIAVGAWAISMLCLNRLTSNRALGSGFTG